MVMLIPFDFRQETNQSAIDSIWTTTKTQESQSLQKEVTSKILSWYEMIYSQFNCLLQF